MVAKGRTIRYGKGLLSRNRKEKGKGSDGKKSQRGGSKISEDVHISISDAFIDPSKYASAQLEVLDSGKKPIPGTLQSISVEKAPEGADKFHGDLTEGQFAVFVSPKLKKVFEQQAHEVEQAVSEEKEQKMKKRSFYVPGSSRKKSTRRTSSIGHHKGLTARDLIESFRHKSMLRKSNVSARSNSSYRSSQAVQLASTAENSDMLTSSDREALVSFIRRKIILADESEVQARVDLLMKRYNKVTLPNALKQIYGEIPQDLVERVLL